MGVFLVMCHFCGMTDAVGIFHDLMKNSAAIRSCFFALQTQASSKDHRSHDAQKHPTDLNTLSFLCPPNRTGSVKKGAIRVDFNFFRKDGTDYTLPLAMIYYFEVQRGFWPLADLQGKKREGTKTMLPIKGAERMLDETSFSYRHSTLSRHCAPMPQTRARHHTYIVVLTYSLDACKGGAAHTKQQTNPFEDRPSSQ